MIQMSFLFEVKAFACKCKQVNFQSLPNHAASFGGSSWTRTMMVESLRQSSRPLILSFQTRGRHRDLRSNQALRWWKPFWKILLRSCKRLPHKWLRCGWLAEEWTVYILDWSPKGWLRFRFRLAVVDWWWWLPWKKFSHSFLTRGGAWKPPWRCCRNWTPKISQTASRCQVWQQCMWRLATFCMFLVASFRLRNASRIHQLPSGLDCSKFKSWIIVIVDIVVDVESSLFSSSSHSCHVPDLPDRTWSPVSIWKFGTSLSL